MVLGDVWRVAGLIFVGVADGRAVLSAVAQPANAHNTVWHNNSSFIHLGGFTITPRSCLELDKASSDEMNFEMIRFRFLLQREKRLSHAVR
jgi:hypothetical protein